VARRGRHEGPGGTGSAQQPPQFPGLKHGILQIPWATLPVSFLDTSLPITQLRRLPCVEPFLCALAALR